MFLKILSTMIHPLHVINIAQHRGIIFREITSLGHKHSDRRFSMHTDRRGKLMYCLYFYTLPTIWYHEIFFLLSVNPPRYRIHLSVCVCSVLAYESQGVIFPVCSCSREDFSVLCRFHLCCVQSFFSVSRRWLEKKFHTKFLLSFLLISVDLKKVFECFAAQKKLSWRTLIEN